METMLPRLRRILPLWITALISQAAAFAGDPTPAKIAQAPPRQFVKMRLAGQEGAARKLGCENCQWLEPRDVPQKKLLQEPKYKSNKPIYYAARYGDGKDSVYSLVLDESNGPGKGYDTIYVDANNDNRIDAETERFQLRVGDSPQAGSIRIPLQVTSGGVTAPYHVSLSAFEHCDAKFPIPGIHITLRDSSYYVGEAVFGAEIRKIAVADLNGNGLFNDVEPEPFQGDRFFVALDRDGQFYQSFPYGGFTRVAGQWYSIVASPDGSRVEITVAKPPLGRIESPAQIIGARLNSPTQPLDLELQDGSDQAVAGTYRLHSVQLLAENGWAMPGSFPDGEPELTVRAGQTVRLAAGLPLKVQPQVVSDEDRTLRISLRITGAGGESYRWSQRRGASSQAGFEIFDSSGKQIASGGFEYG
jgi:hypothetical protein